MKSWLYYALAFALVAAPIGWLSAGFLAAQDELIPATLHRGYRSGNYSEVALITSIMTFVITLLVGLGRRSSGRETKA